MNIDKMPVKTSDKCHICKELLLPDDRWKVFISSNETAPVCKTCIIANDQDGSNLKSE